MGGNDHSLGLCHVTGCLVCTMLNDETAETTEENILIGCERIFYTFHETFHDCKDFCLLKTGVLGDLGYDVCLCHFQNL